jgi:anaerobic selenocysteine-containing dehydrogenase
LAIVVGESAVPPLASSLSSKLYRESNLRQPPGQAALAPATARAAGLSQGSRAIIETRSARLPVVIAIDPGLPPDVVRVAGSAALCDLEGPSAWGKVVAA